MILFMGVSWDYNLCLGDDDSNDHDQDKNEHDENYHDHDQNEQTLLASPRVGFFMFGSSPMG